MKPLPDPPLTPDGEQGRELLRRELSRSDYHDSNFVDRMAEWLGRRFDEVFTGTSNASNWSTIAGLIVLLGFGLLVAYLVSRTRLTLRASDPAPGVLGAEPDVTAAQLRARAEAALAAGDWSVALLDGYRSLALRQIEAGRIDNPPGATAHELADSLQQAFPGAAGQLTEAAWLFDLICYGGRRATREQAERVLAVEGQLVPA